uniref:RNA polymerase II-associated factor 1 homolog n=1 Tax=Sinocyclocheilus anshuiensis TaxID=1608454 RepID=A0A671LDX7_9TELE
MAPTIQTQREDGHRSGVVCRVKYANSLPDIPFDPKFITYPFDQHRFVQYKATSLEKQHKHELLTEPDLGVTIDLINPDTYRIDPSILLDPADEKLLEEEIQAPSSSKRCERIISCRSDVFLIHSSVGIFQIAQHYSKPRVTPVEVLPVFPDFKMWINPCAQVIFDSDPAPKDVSAPAGVDMMSQAMIRGMMDEEGNQFVAYFLPNEDTMRKHSFIKQHSHPSEVRLSKRRAKVGAPLSTNAVLVCKHRDMNEKELEAQVSSHLEREKASNSDNSESESEREDEERPADEEEEEDEESSKRRERKSSGSESGEDRQARDEEEIFGSDDDSEDDEGERARSNSSSSSSSVQHSGSERASDSSDDSE